MVITLGGVHKFRFNHPAEAALLRERRRVGGDQLKINYDDGNHGNADDEQMIWMLWLIFYKARLYSKSLLLIFYSIYLCSQNNDVVICLLLSGKVNLLVTLLRLMKVAWIVPTLTFAPWPLIKGKNCLQKTSTDKRTIFTPLCAMLRVVILPTHSIHIW